MDYKPDSAESVYFNSLLNFKQFDFKKTASDDKKKKEKEVEDVEELEDDTDVETPEGTEDIDVEDVEEVPEKKKVASITDMDLADIIDHPLFIKGFNRQLEKTAHIWGVDALKIYNNALVLTKK